MHPILFENDWLTVRTFGVFLLLSFLLFTYLIYRVSHFRAVHLSFLTTRALSFFFAGLIGSQVFFVLNNLPSVSSELHGAFQQGWSFTEITLFIVSLLTQGMSIYGGIVGFLVFFFIVGKLHHVNFKEWFDILVVSFLPALSLGMIGAFLGGEWYGLPSLDFPFGVVFSNVNSVVPYTAPIHPIQLYFLGVCIVGSVIGAGIFRRSMDGGLTAAISVAFVAMGNFFIEYMRGEEVLRIVGLSMNQILSLILLFVSGYFLFQFYLKKN